MYIDSPHFEYNYLLSICIERTVFVLPDEIHFFNGKLIHAEHNSANKAEDGIIILCTI